MPSAKETAILISCCFGFYESLRLILVNSPRSGLCVVPRSCSFFSTKGTKCYGRKNRCFTSYRILFQYYFCETLDHHPVQGWQKIGAELFAQIVPIGPINGINRYDKISSHIYHSNLGFRTLADRVACLTSYTLLLGSLVVRVASVPWTTILCSFMIF